MKKDKLPFISDENLFNAAKETLRVAVDAIKNLESEEMLSKNVLDPWCIMYEISGFGFNTLDKWIQAEKQRQAQKTLQNQIGAMHQKIIGAIHGWRDSGAGGQYDVICEAKQILADVKNKHNTLNSKSALALYDSLDGLVTPKASSYAGYTAYHIQIIPPNPKPYNKLYTPSDSSRGKKRPENESIRVIDGASFYEIATGDAEALSKLYDVLPDFIEAAAPEIINEEFTFDHRSKEYFKQLFKRAYIEKPKKIRVPKKTKN